MAMSNHVIYLSKSNRANPDYVMLVRRHLESLGYEILEHQGGDYDEQLIYKARYMVMVGIDPATSMNGGAVLVGKGQYNQLANRRNRSTNYYNLYYSHNNAEGKPVFRKVVNDGVVDSENWTSRYGKLRVSMATVRVLPSLPPHKQKPKPEYDPYVGADSDIEISEGGVMWRKAEKKGTLEYITPVHLACITLFN